MPFCVMSRICRSSVCCRLLIVALLVVSVSSAATKLFECPEKFGYFPDESDCSKYFMCVFGDAFHERCTSGLHFSPNRRICDWPRSAQCEKGNGVPDASASTPPRSSGKATRFGSSATSNRNNALLSRSGSRYQVTENSLPAFTRAPVRSAPTSPPLRSPDPTERTHPVLTPAPETRYSPRIINTRLVALTEASRPPGYYNVNNKKPENLQPVTEDEDEEEDDVDDDINIYVRPVYEKKNSREEAVGIKEERQPDPESLVVVLTNNGRYKDQDVSIQKLPDITKSPEDNNPIYVRKAEVPESDYKNNIRRSPSIGNAYQQIQTPNRQAVNIPSRQPSTHGFGRPRSLPETSAARPISSPINSRSKDVPINSRQVINPIYNPSKNAITRPNPIRTNGRTPLASRQGSTYLSSLNRSPDVSRHGHIDNRSPEYTRRGSTYASSNNNNREPDVSRQQSYSNSRRVSDTSRQYNVDNNNRDISRQNSYSSERRAPATYHSTPAPRRQPDVPRATAYNPPRRIPLPISTQAERSRYLPQTVATSRHVTPTPAQERVTPQTSFRQQLSVYLKRVPDVSVPSTYNSGSKTRNSEDVIPVSRTRTINADVSSVQNGAYGVPKQSIDNSDSLDAQYGTNPTSVRLPDNPIRVQSFNYNKDEAKKRGYSNNQASHYQFEDEQGDYPDYYFDEDDEEEEEEEQYPQRTTPRPVRVTTPLYRPPPPPPTTTTTTTTTTRAPPTRASKRRLPTGISRPATRAPSIYAGQPPPPASRSPPVYATPRPMSTAGKCSASKCRLPDCYCSTTDPPNGVAVRDIPQMVLLTFDDAMNDLNFELYSELFGDRKNPNGCPALGTFYVSHEWTDYGKVQSMYSQGHEMASHGVTHSFGEKFPVEQWHKEIHGQREILHLFGGVKMEDVRGMRAPFLQTGGNKMFEMLFQANFTYDSSLPVPEGNPPMWPYTLDYQLNHQCMIPPCPTKSFPGLWEVGMVMWTDLRGGRCSMADACSNPTDDEGVYKMLMKNFNRHYKTNRAPFGLFYHSAWFNTPHHRRAFMKFFEEINTRKDVWIITNWQAIQWMRNPTPISRINSFEPWKCDYSDRPGPCHGGRDCHISYKGGSRSMRTCQPCPSQYPWLGKTGFEERYG